MNGDERQLMDHRRMHTRQLGLNITEPDPNDELTREADMAAIFDNCIKTWLKGMEYIIGYPLGFEAEYGALNHLMRFPINNFGDPFLESNYCVNGKQFEVGVLDWFASLYKIEKDKYWGYITNGGTESNCQAILMGREMFCDGILYTSEESHFSVFKIGWMYRINCVIIKTLECGKIDCEDFKHKLISNKDKPAIVNLNIGTTFKGAIDDLNLVIQTLTECGFSRNRFYIHCDAALFGLTLPFIEQAPQMLTFKHAIDSVSVSCHKFLACPMPCSVLITRLENVSVLSKNVEYLATRDVTISCSRNGHVSILLWYILNKKGFVGIQKDVEKCLHNARYLKDKLKVAGISSMLNELSNIVVFERPLDEEFIRRWTISCVGSIAHVAVMQNVPKQKLDEFIDELVKKRAIWFEKAPCVAFDIGEDNCLCPRHKQLSCV